MFDTRWYDERKRQKRLNWRYNHICVECGYASKVKLTAAHTIKSGKVCEPCRVKLWEG